jgi:hypothetical protein
MADLQREMEQLQDSFLRGYSAPLTFKKLIRLAATVF